MLRITVQELGRRKFLWKFQRIVLIRSGLLLRVRNCPRANPELKGGRICLFLFRGRNFGTNQRLEESWVTCQKRPLPCLLLQDLTL
jgi:hypothetical protein